MVYFICGTIITVKTLTTLPEINHVGLILFGIALLWDICYAVFMWKETVNNNRG